MTTQLCTLLSWRCAPGISVCAPPPIDSQAARPRASGPSIGQLRGGVAGRGGADWQARGVPETWRSAQGSVRVAQ